MSEYVMNSNTTTYDELRSLLLPSTQQNLEAGEDSHRESPMKGKERGITSDNTQRQEDDTDE